MSNPSVCDNTDTGLNITVHPLVVFLLSLVLDYMRCFESSQAVTSFILMICVVHKFLL